MYIYTLSLSLFQVCLYCVSLKQTQQQRRRLRDDSNWNSLDSILFRSPIREQKKARVCVYFYIYARVYITEQQRENVTIIRVLLLLFVCVRYYSSLIRDDVFCVEFWSADESFSLSPS